MSNQPLVSCIIIFFNAEQFFAEAIESIFSQTYDNWELILADDGSTDSSTTIAQSYTQQYPNKVRYVEHEGHENRGMSATRNLGIRNSQGKYIAFLDSDDVWLPHKLEQQVVIMESHPEAAMVYGASLYWYGWTGKPEDLQLDQVFGPTVPLNTLIEPPTLLTSCIFVPEHKAATPPPSNILLRRESVERIGGFQASFTGIYQMFEDQAFFTKLYLRESVFVASECWDKYRVHPNSCCSTVAKVGNVKSARLFFLDWAQKYLSEQGINNPQIWQALKRKRWLHHHPFWDNLFKNAEYAVEYTLRQIRILPSLIARRMLPANFYQWLKFQFKRLKYISQA